MNETDSVRTLNLLRGMFVVCLMLAVMFLLVVTNPALSLPAILRVGLVLYLIVFMHARITRYVCRKCFAQFKISTWIDMSSPHWFHTKLLRCPHCGEVAWHGTLNARQQGSSSI
jgi:hypothetical protein